MDFLPDAVRWDGGLDLPNYIGRDASIHQGSTQPSDNDGGCSTPDYKYRGRDVKEPRPESLATTLEDEERDGLHKKRTPRELAMTNPVFHPTQTTQDLVANSTTEEQEPFHPALRVRSESSTGTKQPWNYLDHVDKHVFFLAEVQKLEHQRRNLQILRVRARDGRSRMKVMRNRLHRTLRDFVSASKARPFHAEVTTDLGSNLRGVEVELKNLDDQDIDLDKVEGDLVPAEWKLKKSEQRLYKTLLGPPASDQNGSQTDVDMTPKKVHGTTVVSDNEVYSPDPNESTAQERLSALVYNRWQLKDRLMSQEKEHAALQKDMQMRAVAGFPVDDFSRNILEDFAAHRGRLLRQLAYLTTQINALEDLSQVSAHDPTESDTLFGLDQFHGLEVDSLMQDPQPGDYEALQLNPPERNIRKADIEPFLAQLVLDRLSHAQDPAQQIFVPAIVQYSSVDWDKDVGDPENLSIFVSLWILGCIKSSWWSFTRFTAWANLPGESTNEAITEILRTTWFHDSACLTPQIDRSEDPESTDSFLLITDEALTPISETVEMREPSWQVFD